MFSTVRSDAFVYRHLQVFEIFLRANGKLKNSPEMAQAQKLDASTSLDTFL